MAKAELVPKFSMSEVNRELDAFSTVVYRRIIQSAANFGANAMVSSAKQALRRSGAVRTGQLGKSLGKVKRTYPKNGVTLVVVGARAGFKIPYGTISRGKNKGRTRMVNPANYAHLVDQGFFHKRGGRRIRGVMFMSDGPGRSGRTVAKRIHSKLEASIEKEMRKAMRRAGI